MRDSDLDEKMAGFSRQKVKSAHDFTPGRSHLGVMMLQGRGGPERGGGRYVLCWWEVIHTVALADIYPERDISPPGALRIDTDM